MRQDSGTTSSGAGARRAPTLAGDAGAWLSTLAQIEPGEFDEKSGRPNPQTPHHHTTTPTGHRYTTEAPQPP